MKKARPGSGVLPSLLIAVLLAGCSAQRGLERAAMDAADQIAALKIEVQQKVDAENDFYDQNMKEMRKAIADARSLRMRRQIAASADAFISSRGGGSVSDQDLVKLAQDTVTKWKTTEDQLAGALNDASSSLASGRRDLQSNLVRISGVQSQLRSLGQARNKKQLARFIYSFASASADEYLRLSTEAAANNAPGEADGGNP